MFGVDRITAPPGRSTRAISCRNDSGSTTGSMTSPARPTAADASSDGGRDVTFSVIVPTSGRSTLLGTLESIVSQLEPGDEVIVVRDGAGDWGHSARNAAMPRAKGTHLLFQDDDDQYANGALAEMRRFAREQPDRI